MSIDIEIPAWARSGGGETIKISSVTVTQPVEPTPLPPIVATPRTNAKIREVRNMRKSERLHHAWKLARQLERELAEARAELNPPDPA